MRYAFLALLLLPSGAIAQRPPQAPPVREAKDGPWVLPPIPDKKDLPRKVGAAPDLPKPGSVWEKRASSPGVLYLMMNGAQVGAWDTVAKQWRHYFPRLGLWGPVQASPPSWAPALPSAVRRVKAARPQARPPLRFYPPPPRMMASGRGSC